MTIQERINSHVRYMDNMKLTDNQYYSSGRHKEDYDTLLELRKDLRGELEFSPVS